MKLGFNLGVKIPRGFTLQRLADSILRSFGTNASSYPFATLQGAYQTSAGPTAAAVNDPIGLGLDAMGTVGPELVTVNPVFTSLDASFVASTSGGTLTAAPTGMLFGYFPSTGPLFVGSKTYQITVTLSSYTSGAVALLFFGGGTESQQITGTVTFTVRLDAGATGVAYLYTKATGTTLTIGSISAREVTGNHATQTTAINRPTVQRGLFNHLSRSSSPSNWAGAPTSGVVVSAGLGNDPDGHATSTLTVTGLGYLYQSTGVNAVGDFTAALWLQGTSGTTGIRVCDNAGSQQGYAPVTVSADWQLAILHVSFTTSSLDIQVGLDNRWFTGADGTDIAVQLGGVGLFQGTLTAAQILQQGGIPLTTSAAGSNPTAGPYWAQGNGADQFMQLSSVPLSGTADHAMIACVNCNGTLNVQAVFEQTGTTAGIRFGVNANTGHAYGEWTNDAGLTKTLSGGTDARNQIIVITAVQRGNKRDVWLNNVQIATDTTAMGAFTFTSAWLLRAYGVLCWPGAAYCVDLVSGTVTDEQLVVLGKAAAQRAGLVI